jgi:hypothetical protein
VAPETLLQLKVFAAVTVRVPGFAGLLEPQPATTSSANIAITNNIIFIMPSLSLYRFHKILFVGT